MQRNFWTIFSGRKQTKEASGEQQKTHRGPTSHLGAPTPWVRPGASWAPCGPYSRDSKAKNSYKYQNPQK